jgi:hypothetical protein
LARVPSSSIREAPSAPAAKIASARVATAAATLSRSLLMGGGTVPDPAAQRRWISASARIYSCNTRTEPNVGTSIENKSVLVTGRRS